MPFDPEGAASLDVDKGIDLPLFANQVAVAANATDVASGESEKEADGKNILLHRKIYELDAGTGRFGFKNLAPSATAAKKELWLNPLSRSVRHLHKTQPDIFLWPSHRAAGRE